jgi:hypothetical protein
LTIVAQSAIDGTDGDAYLHHKECQA